MAAIKNIEPKYKLINNKKEVKETFRLLTTAMKNLSREEKKHMEKLHIERM